MIPGSILCLALVSSLPFATPINPAHIDHSGDGRWCLTPLSIPEYARLEYRGVEILFEKPLGTLPVISSRGAPLRLTVDPEAGYLVAYADSSLSAETVMLLSENHPVQAVFLSSEPTLKAQRETFDSPGPHSWRFSSPEGLVPPWQFDNPETRLCTLDSLPYIVMQTGDGHSITTTRSWQGIHSSRFPVMVVQMRFGSGVGSGSLRWENDRSRHGSLAFHLPKRGQWAQLILPLVRNPAWRGTIDHLSLSPATHATFAYLDWIQFPQVAQIWATLLESSFAPWAALAGILIGCLAFSRARTTKHFKTAVVLAVAGGCAILPLLLPFDELRPVLCVGELTVPASVPLFAVLALTRRRHSLRPVDHAAWACIVVTLASGVFVAKGAGLEQALEMITLPLAFLAGRSVAGHKSTHGILIILGFTAALLCLHATLFSTARADPLYGSLLISLGRAYWDVSVLGRSAGAFVHPLVLATAAITLGTLIFSTGLARKPFSLAAVGILLVSGVCSGSRVFLVLAGAAVVFAASRTKFRYVAVATLLALAAVLFFAARAPHAQGFLRDLHLEKRVEGLKVTASTLAAKPMQGVGWGRYRRAVERFGSQRARIIPFTTPDNSFARLLAEGGLLGGSLWIGWLLILLHTAYKKETNREQIVPSWLPPVLFLVMWVTYDAVYWEAASIPAFVGLGSTVE